jgi:hypothetical protein
MFIKSLPRRIQNTLRGPSKEKMVFIHIPKCGGTSIKDALRDSLLTLRFWKDNSYVYISNAGVLRLEEMLKNETSEAFRTPRDSILRVSEYLLLYHIQKDIQCIVGHIPFSEIAYRNFGDKYAMFTLLRDPVDRWLSEFYYRKHHKIGDSALELEEYLCSPFGKAQGTQYVLYLGGRSNGNDHRSPEAVNRAKRNLENMAVVGFLDDMRDFVDRFQSRFGIRLDIDKKNVTPVNRGEVSISKSIRDQIENICESDCEIYHHAKQRKIGDSPRFSSPIMPRQVE